ncbi:hypothetical protein BJ878DRAFT_420238, partial [Calycina marina]
ESNSPDQSFFWRFPLGVRERIYQIFFYKPIIVSYFASQVESISLRCHSLIRVCKQVADKATHYFYQNNTLRAVLSKSKVIYTLLYEFFVTAPKFLPMMQNVLLEGHKDNSDLGWYEKAAKRVEKLGAAKAVLHSPTLVVAPRRLKRAVTVKGIQKSVIFFTDFLYLIRRFMKGFIKLKCKTFKFVIKNTKVSPLPVITVSPIDTNHGLEVAAENITTIEEAAIVKRAQRFMITLDLTYFSPRAPDIGPTDNAETLPMKYAKHAKVFKNMKGLRFKIENIFIDHERAIETSICRELGVSEKL